MQDPMEIDAPAALRVVSHNPPQNTFRSVSMPPPDKKSKGHKDTGYVYDAVMMLHRHPTEDHPETPQRISIIFNEMRQQHLQGRMRSLFFGPVKREHAMLVHSEDHWDKVEQLAYMSKEDILNTVTYYEGLSLYVSPSTTAAAKLSCGGVIEACKSVVKGEVRNSFAIVRPPGHHAEPDEHMGFCFFNNVAVAARVVQEELGVKKVLILDWDVHHGNGTQKAFIDDPSVLYISLHRYENGLFYPGGHFGAPSVCGEGAGLGTSVNIGWPCSGMGDAEYLHAFQRIVMPIALEFSPDLVIISAGFDAARGDELGECDVTPAGYAHMTHMLSSLANGKLVVALEGGYSLPAVRDSSMAVMRVLLGESPPPLLHMTASKAATETIYQVARIQQKYWKNIKAPPLEPYPEPGMHAVSIPVLIKQSRARHMFEKYKLMQLPISDLSLKEMFDGLILCSLDIFKSQGVVLFIHNFGDLHAELMGESTCDLDIERSYIMDASDEVVSWALGAGFSFIDLNVFPNPHAAAVSRDALREAITLQRRVITYVWDNYIELLQGKPVYLIAYGGAAFPITELFRARDATKGLSGVVQIVGDGHQPAVVKQQGDVFDWFVKNCVVYTGVNPADLQELKERPGLGRVEIVIPRAERGAVVMRKAVPTLAQLVKSGRPFGDEPPIISQLPPTPVINGIHTRPSPSMLVS